MTDEDGDPGWKGGIQHADDGIDEGGKGGQLGSGEEGGLGLSRGRGEGGDGDEHVAAAGFHMEIVYTRAC